MGNFIRNIADAIIFSDLAMTLRYGNNGGHTGHALDTTQSCVAVAGIMSVAGLFFIL